MTAITLPKPEISGVLVIDKPAGITSHDVVARVRKILHQRQVGHFGTLDPFATGVLPVSVGKATRFAQFYLKSRKAYEGTIHFGFSTDTYDATGEATSEAVAGGSGSIGVGRPFSPIHGAAAANSSALLCQAGGGSARLRAGAAAQAGKPDAGGSGNLRPGIAEFARSSRCSFAVECSGGTYVRSLAHDLGQKLGCGAHLAGLRRTAVAEFTLQRAVTLERLQEAAQQNNLESCICPAGSPSSRLPGIGGAGPRGNLGAARPCV